VAKTAALIIQTTENRHESQSIPIAESGDDRPIEPRCEFCGRPAGRYTRFDFLPPPRRTRRHRDLPRDRLV